VSFEKAALSLNELVSISMLLANTASLKQGNSSFRGIVYSIGSQTSAGRSFAVNIPGERGFPAFDGIVHSKGFQGIVGILFAGTWTGSGSGSCRSEGCACEGDCVRTYMSVVNLCTAAL